MNQSHVTLLGDLKRHHRIESKDLLELEKLKYLHSTQKAPNRIVHDETGHITELKGMCVGVSQLMERGGKTLSRQVSTTLGLRSRLGMKGGKGGGLKAKRFCQRLFQMSDDIYR